MNEPHPSTTPLGPGMVLGQGKYQVVSLLGSGGMGDVYLGRHLALDREVAIKVLRARTSSTEALARFRREALLASRLEHPNVVRVLDFDEENGTAFIVMDLVRGDSLFERVVGTRLELDDLVGIVEKVCAALEAAHHAGLLHRDLKPENILLEAFEGAPGVIEERVKVCDFGLAKAYTEEAASNPNARSLTRVGEVSGTPEYMSPEQARGERLDPRSDLYSVGTILFHLAAGRAPYTASNAMGVLMRHVNDPVPRLRDVVPEADPRLERIIMKAMAKEPDDRFQSAAALRDALLSLVSSTDPTTQPPASLGQTRDTARTADPSRLTAETSLAPPRRLRRVGFAVAALLCFGAGLWGLVTLSGGADEERPTADEGAPEDHPVEGKRDQDERPPAAELPPLHSTPRASGAPASTPVRSEPPASEPDLLEADVQLDDTANSPELATVADRPPQDETAEKTSRRKRSAGTTQPHEQDTKAAAKRTETTQSSIAQPAGPSLRAKASLSHLEVKGGAQAPVERAIEKERGQFEACYRAAAQAARRDAEQTLNVQFSVVANTPEDVRVLDAELVGLNDCVRNSLRRLDGAALPNEGSVEVQIHLAPVRP